MLLNIFQKQSGQVVNKIGTKYVSNWKQNMLYTKSQKILLRKRVYIYVKDLKVSSLSCKCVCYCQEHNAKGTNPMELNFESLEIPKWNVPTDRAQRVDEKIGLFI